ncbi:hypothetical protein [Flavobacterium sp.]|uniref:pPIWI-associating nuclease domain-containing protein n=1 Tax=Flavobacterium sp. TaxID=239 RepID=UPI00262A0F88|nr:hypothetical protein [Flavobacterium sp.]
MDKNLQEKKEKLEKLVSNHFEKELLNACFDNLNDENNKLRFNNFAYSIRELSRHILHSLAPDDEVLNCSWYKNEIADVVNGITRGQRIKYAIQGGLSDEFVAEVLLDFESYTELKREIIDSITLMSKYTHVNEPTFNIDAKDVEYFSKSVICAFEDFIDTINSCKEDLVNALEDRINEQFFDDLMLASVNEIDILSTHHEIESIESDEIVITKILSQTIEIEAHGNVDVRLQWGSDRDVLRGNGAEMQTDFPFTSKLTAQIDDKLPNSTITVEEFEVDTESWYGEDEVEDEDA